MRTIDTAKAQVKLELLKLQAKQLKARLFDNQYKGTILTDKWKAKEDQVSQLETILVEAQTTTVVSE